MCSAFVNNYSPDYAGEKLTRHRLAMNTSAPDGFRDDSQFSKTLSYLLRHGAPREKLEVHPGGYVNVKDILHHFRHRCSEEDIERVVAQDKKKRYDLRRDPATGTLQIRANQGHSFHVDDDGSLLEDISNECELQEVTHGTTAVAWLTIKKEGLRRMTRNHIHFVPGRVRGDHEMLPGYRNTSTVLIIVDIRRAILDGIRFYRSQNNVILSPGDAEGCIPTTYFKQVIDCRTHEKLWPIGGDTSFMREVAPESPITTLCTRATTTDWKRIQKQGLSLKKEKFIRFTKPGSVEQPTEENTPTVLITIDARKAMSKGIKFYYSNETDDVILSKGDAKGFIPVKCLKKAVNTRNDTLLWPAGK